MAKINRAIDTATLQDPYQIDSVEYNWQSGGKKSLTVGPHLIPIPIVTAGTPGWTTNVSGTAVAIPYLGANLAIYNNAGTAGSITIGWVGVTSQAIGAVDANGNAGVACPPNAWTYLSMGNNQYVISSASTLITYIIEDSTKLIQETGPYAQQFVNGTLLPINS